MANKILVSYAEFEATIQKFERESSNLQAAIDKTTSMISSLEGNWDSKSARAYIAKLRQKLNDYRAAKQKVDDYKKAVEEVRRSYEENETDIEQKVNALDDKTIFANS